mgnify:CR=1 FL=1
MAISGNEGDMGLPNEVAHPRRRHYAGAIRQAIIGNHLMRLRIRGDVTKREQSGRPLVEVT